VSGKLFRAGRRLEMLGKQEVLKLLQETPDEAFNVEQFIEEVAFRNMVEQRLQAAEKNEELISHEEVRQRFKWL